MTNFSQHLRQKAGKLLLTALLPSQLGAGNPSQGSPVDTGPVEPVALGEREEIREKIKTRLTGVVPEPSGVRAILL